MKRSLKVALVVALLLGAAVAAPRRKHSRTQASAQKPVARQKVAQGRYAMVSASGARMDVPWELWKEGEVGYSVNEQWIREGSESKVNPGLDATLTRDLHPLTIVTYVVVQETKERAQVECDLAQGEMRCQSGDKKWGLKVESPYDLFLPSPVLLSSIVRRAATDTKQATEVRLVVLDESSEVPRLVELKGSVRFVGKEEVQAGGRTITANRFELSPAGLPTLIVLVSPAGTTLAVRDAAAAQQRMDLVEYKRFAQEE